MKLSDLLPVLEDLAPTRYAEEWDNVGLLVGDPEQSIAKALLTIDYTAAVAEEARNEKCDCIIAYHPPIFDALKRITAPSLIYDAIRRGVAIYSPHTALDVADGGTNDVLADAMGLDQRRALRVNPPTVSACKLVVFVPEDSAERVADALFAAGAGHIGNYSHCSFRSPGTGTFLGEEGATPTIGQAGHLERVAELKLETIVPLARIDAVLRALRAVHPYEEPAFDLVQLAATPERKGIGRIGTFASPVAREEVFGRIKRELSLPHLLIAGPTTGPITRVACCAGSGGSYLEDALSQDAQLYLSGEIRHHDAVRAASRGMTVVCTLHSNSERAVLKRLAAQLTRRLPELPLHISSTDRDPFAIE